MQTALPPLHQQRWRLWLLFSVESCQIRNCDYAFSSCSPFAIKFSFHIKLRHSLFTVLAKNAAILCVLTNFLRNYYSTSSGCVALDKKIYFQLFFHYCFFVPSPLCFPAFPTADACSKVNAHKRCVPLAVAIKGTSP